MRKYFLCMLGLYMAITVYYYTIGWLQLPSGVGLVYPLDDAYIHLAIAKNFALHHAWSVNKFGFDSASSSMLYTLLLSFCIKIFGNWVYFSALLNVIFGFATTYVIYRYFKDFYGKKELLWSAAIFLPYIMLYGMVISGMEHTLHMALMAGAIYFMKKLGSKDFSGRPFYVLLFIVFLLSMVRFESMFFTVTLSFLLLLRKNFWQGLAVLFFGLFSILIFGIISIKSGGMFFPNSVMVKGHYPASSNIVSDIWNIFLRGILYNVSFYKYLFCPLVLLFFSIFDRKRTMMEMFKDKTLQIVIFLTAILQASFAMIEFRYENYLMLSFLLLTVPTISSLKFGLRNFSRLKGAILYICALGIIFISVYRLFYFNLPLKLSSKDVFEKQIKMSKFLKQNYENQKVVANDIGAISYFSNVQLFDIAALGSTDSATFIVENKGLPTKELDAKYHDFLENYIERNHYEIAIIYPGWFPNGVPKSWTAVGSWTIKERYGVARKTVVFYSIHEQGVGTLRQHLKNFRTDSYVIQRFVIP